MPSGTQLFDFIVESNKIEGINRPPTKAEILATKKFLNLEKVTIGDLEEFVDACAPGKRLRNKPGMDVYVGQHVPPGGGHHIEEALQLILESANAGDDHPYHIHIVYETLHPFMDGNGRSGRVLWAWMMLNQEIPPGLNRGFLHEFYYQTLQFSDSRKKS